MSLRQEQLLGPTANLSEYVTLTSGFGRRWRTLDDAEGNGIFIGLYRSSVVEKSASSSAGTQRRLALLEPFWWRLYAYDQKLLSIL